MKVHTVIFSGGMDSLTLLTSVREYRINKPEDELIVISFDYGQRHIKELDYARAHMRELMLPHTIIPLPWYAGLAPGSSQTDARVEVPEGAYDAPTMTTTVVAGRNTVMLALAMAMTEARVNEIRKQGEFHAEGIVYFGAHAGDHFIYPDCRPEYIALLNKTMLSATQRLVSLDAPFQDLTKGDIVNLGKILKVDYAKSWTCYKGLDKPCGKCGSCDERAAAFLQAGIPDPALTA